MEEPGMYHATSAVSHILGSAGRSSRNGDGITPRHAAAAAAAAGIGAAEQNLRQQRHPSHATVDAEEPSADVPPRRAASAMDKLENIDIEASGALGGSNNSFAWMEATKELGAAVAWKPEYSGVPRRSWPEAAGAAASPSTSQARPLLPTMSLALSSGASTSAGQQLNSRHMDAQKKVEEHRFRQVLGSLAAERRRLSAAREQSQTRGKETGQDWAAHDPRGGSRLQQLQQKAEAGGSSSRRNGLSVSWRDRDTPSIAEGNSSAHREWSSQADSAGQAVGDFWPQPSSPPGPTVSSGGGSSPGGGGGSAHKVRGASGSPLGLGNAPGDWRQTLAALRLAEPPTPTEMTSVLRCEQCQRARSALGRVDESNGAWYCHSCWAAWDSGQAGPDSETADHIAATATRGEGTVTNSARPQPRMRPKSSSSSRPRSANARKLASLRQQQRNATSQHSTVVA